MTQSAVTILADIGNKPGTTHRDALTITRRVLRITCQQRDNITAERRALRRQAGKLRQFLPFTAQQVADLERQAREHRAEQLEGTRQVLVAFGAVLLRDPDDIAGALGFDQLADLLSINPAHREQARKDGGESLAGWYLPPEQRKAPPTTARPGAQAGHCIGHARLLCSTLYRPAPLTSCLTRSHLARRSALAFPLICG